MADSGGSVPTGCTYTSIEVNTLTSIRIEIDYDSGSPFVADVDETYYYFQCEDDYEAEDYGYFLCPNTAQPVGQSNQNDLLLLVTSENDLEVLPTNLTGYTAINEAISTDDWLIPHNTDAVCGTNPTCLSSTTAISYYFAPLSPPTFALTDRDLSVPSTRTWRIEDVTLQFDSGRALVVQGTLEAYNSTLEGKGAGSWDGIELASGSSATLNSTTISKAGIEAFNAELSTNGLSVDKGGSGTAVYISGSSSDIELYYSEIVNATASSGTVVGLAFDNSAHGYIGHTDIYAASSNGGDALTATAYAVPEPGNWPYSTGGYNRFNGAYRSNVATSNGRIASGYYPYGGYNDYCSSSTYDMYNDGGTITSVNNKFRSGGSYNYGTVSSIYEQTGATCFTGKGNVLAATPSMEAQTDLTPVDELLAGAFATTIAAEHDTTDGRAARLADAADVFAQVLREQPGTRYAVTAIMGLFHAARAADDERWMEPVAVLASSEGLEQAAALGLMLQANRFWGHRAEAREVAGDLIQKFGDRWEGFNATMNLVEMAIEDSAFVDAGSLLSGSVARDENQEAALIRQWRRLARRTDVVIPPIRWADPNEGTAGAQVLEVEADAYPNPFNPVTTVTFQVREATEGSIVVFDQLGRRTATLATGTFQAGRHDVTWNASGVPSGTYFIVIHVGREYRTVPVTLLK